MNKKKDKGKKADVKSRKEDCLQREVIITKCDDDRGEKKAQKASTTQAVQERKQKQTDSKQETGKKSKFTLLDNSEDCVQINDMRHSMAMDPSEEESDSKISVPLSSGDSAMEIPHKSISGKDLRTAVEEDSGVTPRRLDRLIVQLKGFENENLLLKDENQELRNKMYHIHGAQKEEVKRLQQEEVRLNDLVKEYQENLCRSKTDRDMYATWKESMDAKITKEKENVEVMKNHLQEVKQAYLKCKSKMSKLTDKIYSEILEKTTTLTSGNMSPALGFTILGLGIKYPKWKGKSITSLKDLDICQDVMFTFCTIGFLVMFLAWFWYMGLIHVELPGSGKLATTDMLYSVQSFGIE